MLNSERALGRLRDAYGAGHLSTATLENRAEWVLGGNIEDAVWDLPRWWHIGAPRPHRLGEWELGERGRWVIGRSSGADFTLPDDTISRRHAELAIRAGLCLVRDLGSRNGTYVNGRRVRMARLRRGDLLMLGETELRVR